MKKFLTGIVALGLIAVLVPYTMAKPDTSNSDKGKSETKGLGYSLNNLAPFKWYNPNNDNGDLYLYAKDSSNWEVIEGAGRAKMSYNESGAEFEYELAGFNLSPSTEYTLIYYPDPWPGDGLICLGNGTSDEGGKLYMKDSADTGDLPRIYDWNHPDNPGSSSTTRDGGAKIWLVLSSDVSCDMQKMTGWSPDEYLFEEETIVFDDTNWDLLRLENKNPSNWQIIEDDDILGLLSYNTEETNRQFLFLGFGLEDANYSLISYKESGVGSYVHGTNSMDVEGNIKIEGSLNNIKINYYPEGSFGDYENISGAKMWLIPSNYLTSSTIGLTNVKWLPGWASNTLFETELIFTEAL